MHVYACALCVQVIKSIEDKRIDMYSDGMRMIGEMSKPEDSGAILYSKSEDSGTLARLQL